MEINNLITTHIKQNIPKALLEEGSIINGEIIDIQEDIILLNILGKGIIKAESKLDLKDLVGLNIKFVVESNKDNTLEIKPLIEEMGYESTEAKGKENSISDFLKENNIRESKTSKSLVESLIKYKVPLKSKTISDAVKTLDKLVQLSQLEDDGLVFIDKENLEKNPLDSSAFNNKDEELSKNKTYINNTEKEIKMENNEKIKIVNNNLLENKDRINKKLEIKKELISDIKNFIVSKNPSENELDLAKRVKEFLGGFDMQKDEQEFIDIISFLTKNNIKPSINNISNLKNFMKDPIKFLDNITKLQNKVIENIEDEKTNLSESRKEKEITLKTLDKDLENLYKGNKLQNNKDLMVLKEKIEFLKDLNRAIYFNFIPINYGKEKLEGLINIIKDNKNNKLSKSNINIFINLDTNYLGNITISCIAKYSDLNIKIGIDKEDIELFQSQEETLSKRIEKLGYNVNSLVFLEKKEINIREELISSQNNISFLDIKV